MNFKVLQIICIALVASACSTHKAGDSQVKGVVYAGSIGAFDFSKINPDLAKLDSYSADDLNKSRVDNVKMIKNHMETAYRIPAHSVYFSKFELWNGIDQTNATHLIQLDGLNYPEVAEVTKPGFGYLSSYKFSGGYKVIRTKDGKVVGHYTYGYKCDAISLFGDTYSMASCIDGLLESLASAIDSH